MKLLLIDNWHTLSYHHQPYPGAFEFIKKMAKTWAIYIFTSGNYPSTKALFTPVEEYLSGIIAAEQLPQGKSMTHVLELLQISPHALSEEDTIQMIGNESDLSCLESTGVPLIIVEGGDWLKRGYVEQALVNGPGGTAKQLPFKTNAFGEKYLYEHELPTD